jgi:hypothetical protein
MVSSDRQSVDYGLQYFNQISIIILITSKLVRMVGSSVEAM